MILSDRSIRDAIESGRIVIDPYDPALVQPCSIDIRLGNRFLKPIEDEGGHTFIDPTLAVAFRSWTERCPAVSPSQGTCGSAPAMCVPRRAAFGGVDIPRPLLSRHRGSESVKHPLGPFERPPATRLQGHYCPISRPIGESAKTR